MYMFLSNTLTDMYITCHLRYRLATLWKVKRVYTRLTARKCYLDFCIFFKVSYARNEVHFWSKKGLFIINSSLTHFLINLIVYCWCFPSGVRFVFMKRMDRDSCLLSCEEIGTASDAIKLGLTLHGVAILSWVANRLSCYYCIPLALQHFILNTKLIVLTLHSYVRCCLLTILMLYNLSSYLYSNCLMFLMFWVVSEKKVVDKYFHKSCIKVWQIIILNA